MFPKREPQEGEAYCPYDGVAYSKVPGYISGYGCPICGGIGQYHLPVQKSAQHRMHLTAFGRRLAFLLFGLILMLAMVLVIIGGK